MSASQSLISPCFLGFFKTCFLLSDWCHLEYFLFYWANCKKASKLQNGFEMELNFPFKLILIVNLWFNKSSNNFSTQPTSCVIWLFFSDIKKFNLKHSSVTKKANKTTIKALNASSQHSRINLNNWCLNIFFNVSLFPPFVLPSWPLKIFPLSFCHSFLSLLHYLLAPLTRSLPPTCPHCFLHLLLWSDIRLRVRAEYLEHESALREGVSSDKRQPLERQFELFSRASSLLRARDLGSIVCDIKFTELDNLEAFWADYLSGALLEALKGVFITDSLRTAAGSEGVRLLISVDQDDYEEGRRLLRARKAMSSGNGGRTQTC